MATDFKQRETFYCLLNISDSLIQTIEMCAHKIELRIVNMASENLKVRYLWNQ